MTVQTGVLWTCRTVKGFASQWGLAQAPAGSTIRVPEPEKGAVPQRVGRINRILCGTETVPHTEGPWVGPSRGACQMF